ncbi:unnamed protein product [Allacma fusca]|uniref:Uncharacterized protein n=1 Tax=Allacma fusca TaxID=39272 RepID=A0A8J2KGC8_9HEXA|nr:unnamed protein product [Allacma fusca]
MPRSCLGWKYTHQDKTWLYMPLGKESRTVGNSVTLTASKSQLFVGRESGVYLNSNVEPLIYVPHYSIES